MSSSGCATAEMMMMMLFYVFFACQLVGKPKTNYYYCNNLYLNLNSVQINYFYFILNICSDVKRLCFVCFIIIFNFILIRYWLLRKNACTIGIAPLYVHLQANVVNHISFGTEPSALDSHFTASILDVLLYSAVATWSRKPQSIRGIEQLAAWTLEKNKVS